MWSQYNVHNYVVQCSEWCGIFKTLNDPQRRFFLFCFTKKCALSRQMESVHAVETLISFQLKCDFNSRCST